jgi:tripartite-type tricarboxylate transporter receptor subunit TctC
MQERMTLRRRTFLLSLAAGAAALVSRNAWAQTYPARPVTMVVPFPAGGPTDTVARIFGEHLRQTLGQSVIIENVGGAGATLGVSRVIRAAPDGYTLSAGNSTSHVGGPAIYPFQYNILADLEPVALLSISPTMLIARKDFPANTVPELIAWLKANPDKATGGTSGAGSSGHLASILFQSMTGTRFQIIPYRGAAPAMQDLVSGQIDLRFASEGSQSLPFLRDRQIKALAMLAPTRWPPTPDIPTIDEAGLPGIHLSLWNGIWAPKATPKDIIGKLNAAVRTALSDPAIKQRIIDLGQILPAAEQQSPEALAAYHKAEIEKWWPIIKAANIKPE